MHPHPLPLISHQRWKLRLAFAALLMSGAAMMFDKQLSAVMSVQTYVPTLIGTAVGLAAMVFSVIAVRCPQCGTSLAWLAISQKSSSSWLDWLLDVSVCPKCGHSSIKEQSDQKNAL